MDSHLPDEILSEILSPALKVPDEEFADTSEKSPFAVYSESSSAFLLVSKAWLRVATPLLYHVVVLRSKAQALALDIALSTNPELGRFIKKLRVEGGYGASMLKIVKSAPNVTDLFLSINIWSADNVSGLCRGLPLMNPTRVVLYDLQRRRSNKNSDTLLATLIQCIKQWKNLNVFELPYWNVYAYNNIALSVSSALKEAPNLKILVIPATNFYGQEPPERLQLVAKNPTLKSIRFKQPVSRAALLNIHANLSVINHPGLRGLVTLPDDDTTLLPDTSSGPKPSPKSIQFSTAAVPEKPTVKIGSRLGIILVSKTFARLALPYLNETLFFRGAYTFNKFVMESNQTPSLGPQVKTLYLEAVGHADLRAILPRTKLVNIIGLSPFVITPTVFSGLGKSAGATLVRLEGVHITKATKREKPSLFSPFLNLRSLSATFKAPFDETPASIPAGALATLEQLTLPSFDESLITVLSHMDLNSLRHAAFPTGHAGLASFFGKHGDKLLTITVSVDCIRRVGVFDLCTVMVDLTVHCASGIPDPSSFTSASPRMALETITFKTGIRNRGTEKKWGPFFKSLNITTFPSLRQITVTCIKWPTNEHDISKSLWVKWAEALLDRNVKLIDGDGVGWRRRLKK
ncbi:hypothetical protein B0H17DRAFT_1055415 [Mycena rosella]|uniref:Uncharacterized protein n=1 Tax=Mycena rosella TaxID=1033263 RepID=A0AAD7DN37_MYCRO|nr:hypothetical protein B0H17DRAFT_1055415 [Mycena rosella]